MRAVLPLLLLVVVAGLGELVVHPGGEHAGRQVLVDHRPLVAVHPHQRPGPAMNLDLIPTYLEHMCTIFREN